MQANAPQHFELNEHEIASLYAWIDSATFSRPKKNLTRDFSDGVACAELVHNFLPKLVDLHNFSPANSISQKIYNWHTLNSKVFKKLGYSTTSDIINCIVHMRPGYIEYLLWDLKQQVNSFLAANPKTPVLERKVTKASSPSAKKQDTTPPPKQQASKQQQKKDNSRYISYSDDQQRQHVHPNELAFTARINTPPSASDPPDLPKDSSAHEMQETIKLLQMKVQKMSELLDLKSEKLVKIESSNSGRSSKQTSQSSLRK